MTNLDSSDSHKPEPFCVSKRENNPLTQPAVINGSLEYHRSQMTLFSWTIEISNRSDFIQCIGSLDG